jgi:Inner membrane protein YgaP-like, transmembrane domain
LQAEENAMRPNMGNLDRVIRIAVGLLLLAFALRLGFADTGLNWVGWIGVVPILTALVRFCPAYALLGIRTGK